jgi:hypothetical protein
MKKPDMKKPDNLVIPEFTQAEMDEAAERLKPRPAWDIDPTKIPRRSDKKA